VVQVREKQEEFYFPLKNAPESVRINPDLSLLAKISFKPPKEMVFRQLADNSDIIGQLLALDQLAEKPNQEAVSNIRTALQNAKHHAVRARAAEVLQQAKSVEALNVLVESRKQPDARVRNAVARSLGGWFNPVAKQALEQMLSSEKNPAIQATILRGLGVYQTDEVRGLLLEHLKKPSYKDRVSEAAVAALRTRDDPSVVPALADWILARAATLPAPVWVASMDSLAFLQRNESDKNRVRELLLSYVNHPREKVRLGAITALGTLEDPRAVSVLETYAQASAYRSEKDAAAKALEKIRSARKPGDELKDLRNEVMRLQESGRELKKELETLRKKTEAKP
jgi:aminopeptidase N